LQGSCTWCPLVCAPVGSRKRLSVGATHGCGHTRADEAKELDEGKGLLHALEDANEPEFKQTAGRLEAIEAVVEWLRATDCPDC